MNLETETKTVENGVTTEPKLTEMPPLFEIGETVDLEKLCGAWGFEKIENAFKDGSRCYDENGNNLVLNNTNRVKSYIRNDFKPNTLISSEDLLEHSGMVKFDEGMMDDGARHGYNREGSRLTLDKDNRIMRYARNHFEPGEIVPSEDGDKFHGERILKEWQLNRNDSYSDQRGYKQYLTQDGLSEIILDPNNGQVCKVTDLKYN